jgi:hypothetical protein
MEDRFSIGGIMKVILVLSLLIFKFPFTAYAHPLMYSSDEIRGTIVDGETDHPIEGAVVIANWTVTKMILGPTAEGGKSIDFVTLEAVTNKDGNYAIPAWGPKPVSPLEVMESDSAHITIFKSGYWIKRLSDIEPETVTKRYDVNKLDDKQQILECQSVRTQFEEAVSHVALTTDELAPAHRRSIWNGRTIRLKKFIIGEERKCGEKVMLCEDAKKKYGEDIKCEGIYFRQPKIKKVSEEDLYDQVDEIRRTKNICREILKEKSRFSPESFKKYPLRSIFKGCLETLKKDNK